MDTYRLNGDTLAKMLRGGASNLKNNAQTVNDLNVFPIPDGDTGDNMSRTIEGGTRNILPNDSDLTVSEIAERLADGMLMSARGNSGVILSQFFEGIKRSVSGLAELDTEDLYKAFRRGVEQAYSSVAKPTEGTILTVMREATEYAGKNTGKSSSIEAFFDAFEKEMYDSLDRTPDLLPVLRESGVIDSGGAGFVYIIDGMYRTLRGENISNESQFSNPDAFVSADIGKDFDENSEMKFGYCTELILQLMSKKCDVEGFCADDLIKYLESIGGESVVAFKNGTRVKLHVHTFEPYRVLEYCCGFGELVTVKIENMSIQHNGNSVKNNFTRRKEDKRKEFALVAVAEGEGLKEIFRQFGADFVVDGNQTMNPSTEDFIKAFEAVNAEKIFVLPNNSNIVLAAKQAADMYERSEVYVIPSTTLAEGYSALTMLDYTSGDVDTIIEGLNNAISAVTTGSVTYAVRDSHIGGFDIKTGDWLGFEGKSLLASGKDKVEAAKGLIDSIDLSEKEVIIVICGKDASRDDMDTLRAHINNKYPMIELYEVEGEQDVYSFIFAIE